MLGSYRIRKDLTYIRIGRIYVKAGQHTCMLSAFIGEHTYTATNLGPNMLNSYVMHVMYVCMLGPLEVPPLTNLKKLNKTFNTEGYP